MPSPTMRDVAREAGVALGTVSKVFNDIPVGEDYRRRVLEAAKKLDYRINRYARGLKTNRTDAAALIIPNLTIPFFAAFAQSVCLSLAERGCRMILALTEYDPEAEQRCIRMARENKVDGVIGLTYNPELKIEEDLPYVSFDRHLRPGVPCVSSDNFAGGRLAAEKLLALGCRRPLFLRTGSRVPGESDRRGDGFEAVCRETQTPYEKLWLYDEDGMEPFRAFLECHTDGGKPEFDGIFCATDYLACFIIHMLSGLGLRVPEDVQVIGFDGVPLYFRGALPCSTIVQPVSSLAGTAVDLLLRQDRSALPAQVSLPVSYAAGGTTRD